MKKILFCLLCIFSALIVFSQADTANSTRLTGTIRDEKGAPLPYVNVGLVRVSDSAIISSLISDGNGGFQLSLPSSGSYILRLSAIGFGEYRSGVVIASGRSKDLGIITMKADARVMEEVSVTALRPTIIQKPDRMIVSVEGTAMAAGNTAYSVLAKAPGVFIDHDGNIQLNGRSGVTVMIDGKLTFLSATDLRNLLEGMSAENIKNIEIITNPSAKYDAEGTSGILNINLKKNVFTGINGSVYAGYSYNGKQHAYNSGGNINYQSRSWTSFLSLDFARRVGGREATFTRIFYGQQKNIYFDQLATGDFTVVGPPSVRAGADYNISKKNSIGGVFSFNTNNARSSFLTDTYIGNAPGQPDNYINADNFSRNRYRNISANLHFVSKMDSLGKTFSADVDMARIRNRGSSDFLNYYTDLINQQETTDFLYTYTPQGYNIYSLKTDLVLPKQNGQKWEVGAKASRVFSDNDSRFYFNNNGLVDDPSRTNHFQFTEYIYAGYINWMGDLGKKFSLQTGLRAEQTVNTGVSLTTGQKTERDYLNFFPSVFLQHKVSEEYSISYGYSRRLSRPNYGSLNPFRAYRDPYTWTEGNPRLRPQYTDAYSINQSFKKQYSLALSFNRTTDVIAELPLLDVQNGTTMYYTGNVDNSYNFTATLVAPVKIMKFWDAQNTAQAYYSKFSMHDVNGKLVNKQFTYSLQSNHTILLPAKFRLEANFLYRSPLASGLYMIDALHRVDLAVKKSFFNKKLDITINANDIFKGYRYHFTTDIAGNVNEFDQYFRFRSIGINFRYNFSKGKKVENQRKTTGPEELNRT